MLMDSDDNIVSDLEVLYKAQLKDDETVLAVEKEDFGNNFWEGTPFNPKDIDISQYNFTIGDILRRLSVKPFPEIDLYPEFQRRDDLWDEGTQSRLIESILISFPLPAFYFDGSDYDRWLVIDGIQRLSTLRNFALDKTLVLTGLEFLKQLEGSNYDQLPRFLQRKIAETQIVAFVSSPGTPDSVKFNIFKRLNTGGLILQPQEIRFALNQGIPSNFITELAETQEFLNATNRRIPTKRMIDRDFITRFIAFYLSPPENYIPDLDTYLNKKMRELNNLNEIERAELKQNFIEGMKLSQVIFGETAFQKIFDKSEKKHPISKSIFEIWSVKLSKLDSEHRKIIKQKKGMVLEEFIKLCNSDGKFMDAISSSTAVKSKIIYRFKQIEDLIQKILKV